MMANTKGKAMRGGEIKSYPKESIKLTPYKFIKLKERVYDRDLGTCQICHRISWTKHPHHIIPTGRIRIDHIDNLLTTCLPCHRTIHDTPGMVDKLIERYSDRLSKWSKGES